MQQKFESSDQGAEMHIKPLSVKLPLAVCVVLFSSVSNANCSDAEYRVYQQYDQFLEANPSVSDDQLRLVFAKKVGMQPSALKNLYIRCTIRWSEQSPNESKTFLKKDLEGFAKDCAQRPNDPYCKAVLGK